MTTRSILVTDGEQRSALAVVRSLGRLGHRTLVGAARIPSLAGASRYATAEVELPDPIAEPQRYGREVLRLVHARGIQMILPITEASLLSILPLRDELAGVEIPFPPAETFRAICDKTRLFETARELGIAVPDGWLVPDAAALRSVSLPAEAFPLVAKPGRSVAGEGDARQKLGVVHVRDSGMLATLAEELPTAAFPLHLQERIRGPGMGIFLLVWQGSLLARFAHRRIREKPPAGGVSVLRESVPADPELVEASRRLLERYRWNGVAMVEFKLEEETGRAYLMEVNGRFWGSLQLAIDSGVDFPRLLVEATTGDALKPVTAYRTGTRTRWLWGDVDHLVARLRHSRADLSLADSEPGRLRTILAFLGAFFTSRGEVLRFADPRPAIRETADWLRPLLRSPRRGRNRVRSAEGQSA